MDQERHDAVMTDIKNLCSDIACGRPAAGERALVHCITNPISIKQCADTVLSAGARPIMAEHPLEAAEITETAAALMLNTGNITDARMRSITISAQTANKNNIPFILDVVGISCSRLRKEYIEKLLGTTAPTIIKGNYSEICALYDRSYKSSGIDAHASAYYEKTLNSSVRLAGTLGCVILASGQRDIVTNGEKIFFIDNGSPRLGEITGTGCMLGALTAAYLTRAGALSAAAAACATLGICGEKAARCRGMGSFSTALFDELSLISKKEIMERIRVKEDIFETA